MPRTLGVVYLVGAGPGDPGLITVRGLGLVRRADVVLHDRLVSRELILSTRRGAEIICVGKSPGGSRTPQERTNELLIRYAKEGKTVVRLKGGDPFVFGRGFEEFRACRDAGVPCVVIPGVSSALAGPLAAGIPITSRRDVRSVGIITGSFAGECQAPPLDYGALAKIDTLIVMMGLAPLGEIASSLLAAGRDPNTPASSIENATTPQQRIVRATLGTIAGEVAEAGLTTPVVTVIGVVAAHAPVGDVAAKEHEKLLGSIDADAGAGSKTAFDSMGPLAGRRIVITRPYRRARSLHRALCRAGAEVIACPLIEIDWNVPAGPVVDALSRIGEYDWIVFTSASGVEGFFRRLFAAGMDARALTGLRVGVVGSATARALKHRGVCADLMPRTARAEMLADELIGLASGERIGRVLFPRGDRAMKTLAERLRAAGADVDEITVYRTVPTSPSPALCDRVRADVDAVMFYSPSAVTRFKELGLTGPRAIAACIGSTTAQVAASVGLPGVVRFDAPQKGEIADAVARILQGESA